MAEDTIEEQPPHHLRDDWNFFKETITNNPVEIPYYFDQESWSTKKAYKLRVGHIYDLSHFWIVTKEREASIFYKYLQLFYSKYKDHYKIPSEDLRWNMYCVVCSNDEFSRAILVDVPVAIGDNRFACLFLIDFGCIVKVSINDIYFMPKKLYSVPRYSIRAILAGLGPENGVKWSTNSVNEFQTLVFNQVLIGQIKKICSSEKIIFVSLNVFNPQTQQYESIEDTLVRKCFVKQLTSADVKEMKTAQKNRGPKKAKPIEFLTPTFKTLEYGRCVDSFAMAQFLDEYLA
ncbi:hypothetical protein ABEB36_002109 [Hypothenemus hampei]|uniref:Tudor domain-containing protein n=1 Tax=Hypothenemus hampei TaxID=57062 RepID=A0ABD1F4K8_HYPHA